MHILNINWNDENPKIINLLWILSFFNEIRQQGGYVFGWEQKQNKILDVFFYLEVDN